MLRTIDGASTSTKTIDVILTEFCCEMVGSIAIGCALKYNDKKTPNMVVRKLQSLLLSSGYEKKGTCSILLSICQALSMIILESNDCIGEFERDSLINALTYSVLQLRTEQKERVCAADIQVVSQSITRTISICLRTGKVNDKTLSFVENKSIHILANQSLYADLLVNVDNKENFFDRTSHILLDEIDSDEELSDEALVQFFYSVRLYCIASGNLIANSAPKVF